ncbi:glycosyltransferase family 4 protein [Trinickia caryophylli]|uniref:Glycosyltransferase involved in cell wall bisynthesis n=1 Tax=Trinickia caryophylli TaxID=28094 RepID=A0A1X7EAS0_TRICW|nr:glycosyltransferase family 4 protein [Trinickia caryophylli]PMS12964.1 glycosyltransferase family 4 protein [Trinickia caryophylli]TRX14728.1 glycosyltransferase family 4 protein [Trinickia caryophylli]WQE14572.1 glycosyltransferase family 4 protein [Trinickia caryophylli]SMF30599.1 Glycosyltransferase involved in cell wall bisynthesis [Trinickia caryophylli]GLU32017.1 glycosyl transferase [Trinickia caryophylli]
MRIAQVATLYESVPPRAYGGIERVVSWLTEALVECGHDVTLFASGDSSTRGRLVKACPSALRLIEDTADPQAFHFAMLEQVVHMSAEFDVVHFHTDYQSFPFARRLSSAHLTTLHWRLDLPGLEPLYRAFSDVPLVSISQAQRAPLPWADWIGTVYHGLPVDQFSLGDGRGGYLAFLGRIAPSKRPDLAIEIAERADIPIKIAAKIDNGDRWYYDGDIEPLFRDPRVEYRGELGDHEKNGFLGSARALLFPIDWPEPFGLVMIEALACGTPVIAFNRGSVPEIIEHGVTGFVVDDVQGAVDALARLPEIDRAACRAAFEQRFTVDRMTDDYAALYTKLVRESSNPARTGSDR